MGGGVGVAVPQEGPWPLVGRFLGLLFLHHLQSINGQDSPSGESEQGVPTLLELTKEAELDGRVTKP